MKTKLTPEIKEEITKRLKVGCYAKMAAAAIGICERTYYYWLERGEKALKLKEIGRKVPQEEKIFLQFLQSVRQSEAEGEVALTAMIFSQAKDDWRAAMELLSRKYPERCARKEYLDFKGSMDQGPDKCEEALNEFEEMFADVPKGQLSKIISETNEKLREAKNKYLQEKELKNKKLQTGLNQ